MNLNDISESLETRFYQKIKINLFDLNGCILWTASLNTGGYGQISDGKNVNYSAHVVSYTLHYGSFKGYNEVDHICRNRKCVNPYHLRLLTPGQNVLAGEGVAAKNARKTHCKHGHEFTKENTYIHKSGIHRGCRACKECRRISVKRYRGFNV